MARKLSNLHLKQGGISAI